MLIEIAGSNMNTFFQENIHLIHEHSLMLLTGYILTMPGQLQDPFPARRKKEKGHIN